MAKPVDTDSGPVKALKSTVAKFVKAQLLAKFAQAAPFLFGKAVGWFVNPVAALLIDKLLAFLLDKTILGVALIWIAIDMSYEIGSAEDATKKLKDIFENPEKYTTEQIKEVEANFDEHAAELIRIGSGKF